ncbi:MAG: guanylate kinase [Planctomycetota bacterium]
MPESSNAGDLGTSSATGRLVVISGPSGAGKSTVVRQLIESCGLPLELSVSVTTRLPRPGEVDGVHYHFVGQDEFDRRRNAGDFLESKEVFGQGIWYGTLGEQVSQGLEDGRWVILEIDVQGAMAVLENSNLDPITVFIHPGGLEELEKRLRHRKTETENAIFARLKTAAEEMHYRHRYQYEVINQDVDQTVDEICQILQSQN